MTETSTVFPWTVRHAAWLCTRYGVKQDGRTAYERLRNRGYKGEVAEFGEVVLYKFSNQNLKKLEDKWACGVWLGKSLSNDEHFVATPNGIQRCRSIRRRVQAKRFEVGCVSLEASTWSASPSFAFGRSSAATAWCCLHHT